MKNFLPVLAILCIGAGVVAQTRVVTIEPAGESCGPQLNVTMTPLGEGGNYRLQLHATGLQPRTMAALNFGSNPMHEVLPGGCLLLSDAIWSIRFQTDTRGEIEWGRSWPNNFFGYFYMQMGSLHVNPDNSYEVKTTNCKLVTVSWQ